MGRTKRRICQGVCLGAAVCFLLYGAVRGEVGTVWNKAVNICLECIGLG